AGDVGKDKVVLDALKRYNVSQLDYLIATHAHPDHIGGAAEVIKAVKVITVLHNNSPPPGVAADETAGQDDTRIRDLNIKDGWGQGKEKARKAPAAKKQVKSVELPTVKTYNEFKSAVNQQGVRFERAEPGQHYDLSGGVRLTVLAPSEPLFTREQMRAGGNEPNANSIVVRLDYGDFSMLLPGDAEVQTEQRMISKDTNLAARILKVAHHGSKYATSEEFLKRVKPEAAIISTGEANRYGHPSPAVLQRLQAAGIRQLYRTDLQGEITITTTGKIKDGKLYEIKSEKEAKSDLWAGREAQKDDSARSGFVAYGDFGPPPRPRKAKKQ
ncbi:MAG TPA: MBL fold metallo-hydrolase, partial [Pyrinomonadaceae bacterium]|nr:MBL fold metallo-hydrolase [Pyrinomonadaceae bacterium]